MVLSPDWRDSSMLRFNEAGSCGTRADTSCATIGAAMMFEKRMAINSWWMREQKDYVG
jgi:hypothetical protein